MSSPFTSFTERADDIARRTARLQRLVDAILSDLEDSDEEPVQEQRPWWELSDSDDDEVMEMDIPHSPELMMYEDGSEVSSTNSFLLSRPATPAPPLGMELLSEETLSPVLAPRVRFAEEVGYIGSPERLPSAQILFGTPRMNHTPWWYPADTDMYGNCSDSETIVDEYEEVCTPVPQGRVLVGSDSTTEEESKEEDPDLYLE